MSSEAKEKKYRKMSWISTILIQVVMLLLFYFLIAWKEPFPPIPSYGIELNFGLEDEGAGVTPPTSTEPTETPVEEEVLEAEESDVQTEEASEPAEQSVQSVEPVASQDLNNDKQVEETAPVKQPSETKATEEKKVNEQAMMPKPAQSEQKTEEKSISEGQSTALADQGKKEGTLDGRALMGTQGSAQDGASLQMAGWAWDIKPQPKDNSAESGKIVYKIKIDGEGYILSIELVSSTVSPVVEQTYRRSVEQLSFSKTSDYVAAPTSTGTITFIVKTR